MQEQWRSGWGGEQLSELELKQNTLLLPVMGQFRKRRMWSDGKYPVLSRVLVGEALDGQGFTGGPRLTIRRRSCQGQTTVCVRYRGLKTYQNKGKGVLKTNIRV